MEGQGCTTWQKCLIAHQRVSGAIGNYIPGPTKRWCHERLFGYVVQSVGNRYLVRFDDREEKSFLLLF